jgi:putative transposase
VAIYANPVYREALLELPGLPTSMSRKGNAWYKAVAEGFLSRLNSEPVHHWRVSNQAEASGAVFVWIEGLHNRRRMHSTLDFVSPSDYEARPPLRSPTCPEIWR